MQVMIGEPGKTVAQQATRTTSNGSDKTGSAGTTITTHGTAQDGRWETYTGDYLATSTTTRFTFRSVRDSNGQGRRRPKLRQGVQALLRQEFFGRDRQRAIQSIRQGEHRAARQVQDRGQCRTRG